MTSSTTNGNGVSIIIPTLNEEANVQELTRRIAENLTGRDYELIFIDDHSTDNTVEILQWLAQYYPLNVQLKRGKPGKAYSLVEGFSLARHETIVMIDADLQYPPEAIAGMVNVIDKGRADVVVAKRHCENYSQLRKFLSFSFRYFFCKLLWGLDVDAQSGLKAFKKEIIERANLNPKSGWAFDMEFLVSAKSGGYRLGNYRIRFTDRKNGETKMKLLQVSRQLGLSAIKLRFKPPYYVPFHPAAYKNNGHGFHYRGSSYTTHTTLRPDEIAVERTFIWQRLFLVLLLAAIVSFIIIDWFATLVIIISIFTTLYFFDLLFNLYLILRSFYKNSEIKVSQSEINARQFWPRYTIFCPLYKEADVLPQFLEAMNSMDYPRDKLEIMLLLEEDDDETIEAARAMNLPDYYQIMVVPHALPKTKPKACNYGLIKATGEYAVIYDAEDIPDTLQLKKAVIGFSRVPRKIGCIQAKLNYYNYDQNLLTRLFTLEYALWFNLVLSGLQSIYAPIPLGGTSNHFRVKELKNFAGWDPFNVTEDADLGMRLAGRGFQTAILDSYTMEEANSEFSNWLKQRSRWIKGYIQTYFVHMRNPRRLLSKNRAHVLYLQLVIGGKVLSMLINPIFWLITIAYFLIPVTQEFIRTLYVGPIFYMGLFSLAIGNFLYIYYYMLGGTKQNRLELNLYALLIPFYWLMMSLAAVYALRDFIIRPHHWHKTKHGLHLKKHTLPADETLVSEGAEV